jgi:GNAT superfamily N-acetyltransferase
MLTPAPLESARFGLRVFRAAPERVDTMRLFEQLQTNSADIAILRVPSGEASAVRRLATYGLAPIHADTLVSYECDLHTAQAIPAGDNGFTIDAAQASDRQAIDELVTTVFAEYPSHYTANPLLARQDVIAGYREWALSHLDGDNRIAWVARVGNRIAAIACSAFDTTQGECQGVLHGVHPDFARGGIYTALIRHTQRYFRRLGCYHLTIQTQVWNVPVQRVWVREGFVLAGVFETFHINALLNPVHGDAKRVELCLLDSANTDIPSAVLGATMHTAGYAESATPLSNLTATAAVLRSIAAGKCHSLLVRTYDFERSCGHRIVVGTLYDPHDNLCAIAQSAIGSPH